jgi:cytoskeleton protein RodZ
MSDENDKAGEALTDDESQTPVGGERLAQARRKLQIPVIEIAKELHLDEYKVRALESNDFDVIGAPVFAKGHLRKYAQMVKVDEADVMADYYQLNRSSGAPPLVSKRPRPQKVVSPGPWAAAVVVIIAVASAYWWFTSRETPPVRPVTGEIAPLPQEPDAVAAETDEAAAIEQPEANEPAVEPDPEPVAPPIAATDSFDLSLSVTYSGDCWTEITDASGRRLFFDLGKSGRTVNLTGEAPFNVLFGDAANVSLTVNGASFNIPAADRRGRTARLTITGS